MKVREVFSTDNITIYQIIKKYIINKDEWF